MPKYGPSSVHFEENQHAQNGTDVVITSAARTPVGSFGGALSKLAAHELGKAAIVEALKRAKIDPGEVSEVILGQILTAGGGPEPGAPGGGRRRHSL